MLGVMFALHSDNKGLVLPPKLVDEKICIVPIIFEDSKKKVLAQAQKIKSMLNGYGAFIDDREDYSPGWKFSEIELKGTPIRIEIGPKDLVKKQVIVVKRNTLQKKAVKISQLKKIIPKLLDEIQSELFKTAENLMKNNIVDANNFKDILKLLENKKIVLAPICSNVDCEDNLKEKTGAKVLNIPLKQPNLKGKKCIICNKDANYVAYIGKSY